MQYGFDDKYSFIALTISRCVIVFGFCLLSKAFETQLARKSHTV